MNFGQQKTKPKDQASTAPFIRRISEGAFDPRRGKDSCSCPTWSPKPWFRGLGFRGLGFWGLGFRV